MVMTVRRDHRYVLRYRLRMLLAWLLIKSRLVLIAVYLILVILGVRLTLHTIMADIETDSQLLNLSDEQKLTLKQRENNFLDEKHKLINQILALEEELNRTKKTRKPTNDLTKMSAGKALDHYRKLSHDNTHTLTSSVRRSSEYEIEPYDLYNGSHLLSSTVGMGVGQVAPVVGRQAVAFQEVMSVNEKLLSEHVVQLPRNTFASVSMNALYRYTPSVGENYQIYSKLQSPYVQVEDRIRSEGKETFQNITGSGSYRHNTSGDVTISMTVVRPFGPLQLVGISSETGTTPINIVLPLSGATVPALSQFITNLNRVTDKNAQVSLTVVYFGNDKNNKIEQILSGTTMPVHLVMMTEPFNRMLGLREGVQHWQASGDVIILCADVHTVLTRHAFSSCRYHTTQGQSVYYPMVFGLFDPHLIYRIIHREKVPSIHNQLRIDMDKGMWQHEQYGVSCQYRADFLKMTSDLHLDDSLDPGTWQDTDKKLYTEYIQSTYNVKRVPDPGYFHLYHPHHCAGLPRHVFTRCMRTKAYSAGSHTQLGFVVFRDQINLHRGR